MGGVELLPKYGYVALVLVLYVFLNFWMALKVGVARKKSDEQVLSAHFRAYIQALEKLQLDIATSSNLIGVEARSSSLFSREREPLKNRFALFALGERINILKVFYCYC
ncbi:Vps52 [Dillenia turbinata]|uniref:Vps52 n=1 Tax=Dillenia turbinata TaxID=194707 RepID=A0AAN8ZEM1_9MAGN